MRGVISSSRAIFVLDLDPTRCYTTYLGPGVTIGRSSETERIGAARRASEKNERHIVATMRYELGQRDAQAAQMQARIAALEAEVALLRGGGATAAAAASRPDDTQRNFVGENWSLHVGISFHRLPYVAILGHCP